MGNQANLQNILIPTGLCSVRQQEDQFLIYNTKTDELFLVSPMGFYVYQLCDGLRTVAEIQELFVIDQRNGSSDLSSRLLEFLENLIARGILQVDESV